MAKVTREVWLAINEDGDYAVGVDAESASESLTSEYTSYAVRCVCINVLVSPPAFDELDIEVADQPAIEAAVKGDETPKTKGL